MNKSYKELSELTTFKERYDYLKLEGVVGEATFGFDRHLNQVFYRSAFWKNIRRDVIIRDNGCDLGVPGFEINDKIIVHHMNPISAKDFVQNPSWMLDPNFLVCVSHRTHLAIHYGDENQIPQGPIVRTPGDTTLW